MTKTSRYIVTLTLLLLTCFMSACSKPTEKAIIGKWTEDGKPGYLEFFQDNTFILDDGSTQLSGKWIKVGDNRIKADVSVMGTTVTMIFEEISFSGNQMNITLNGDKGLLNRSQ